MNPNRRNKTKQGQNQSPSLYKERTNETGMYINWQKNIGVKEFH